MKLRLARKIIKAVGTPDEPRYSDHQIGRANTRWLRTASAKEDRVYWNFLMGVVKAEQGRDGR